jgi:hypothetical protein
MKIIRKISRYVMMLSTAVILIGITPNIQAQTYDWACLTECKAGLWAEQQSCHPLSEAFVIMCLEMAAPAGVTPISGAIALAGCAAGGVGFYYFCESAAIQDYNYCKSNCLDWEYR